MSLITAIVGRNLTLIAGVLPLLAAASACRTASVDSEGPLVSSSREAGTPEIFSPGVISNGLEQWRITFAPDGKTAYFAWSEKFFPFSRKATIHESHLVNGAWTTPVVAPFSGQYSDIDPFITPDGKRLYFSSIRPVDGTTRGDIDVWMVERTGNGWGAPIHLGPEVNSAGDELYPSASGDGTLYFASGPPFPQPGKHYDIYSARRAGAGFAERVALGAGVNTTPVDGGGPQDAWEFNPEVTPDGKTMVFTSLRPGGYGLGDLYVSRFENGAWSAARNLGPTVNTAADEFHPTLSRDRKTLYFVRRVHPADGNFYTISTRALKLFQAPI